MNRQTTQCLTRIGSKASLAVAVAAALALPLAAQAGSFQLPTDNAAGWARANAGGSLFANDATAVYNNPAAMAFFDGPVLQITATGIRPTAKFHGSFTDIAGQPVSGGNPDGFGKMKPFPNMAFAMPVNDKLTLGASVTVPYGLVSEYNPTWQGRYFGTKTSVQSVALTLSAGFKINDEFSLGLGLVGQRTKAQLNSMIDAAGAADAMAGAIVYPPQSADVQLNVNVEKDFEFGYVLGAEFKPTAADSIGISYHSKIGQTLKGDYALYGSAAGMHMLAMAPQFGGPSLNPAGGNASAVLDMPAYANIDWVHQFNDRFSLATTIKWTDWSSFKELSLKSDGQTIITLPERYKDSWVYSIGGDYKLNNQWTLRAGVGYDETPTNIISRDPRIPDGARTLLGLGVGYQANEHFAFDLGYQHQFVEDARVAMVNPPLLGMGRMNGYFKDSGDVISLTGTYKF